jgi:murein DD-endopeptidase MepM/ murein hydrolase activator NlpD
MNKVIPFFVFLFLISCNNNKQEQTEKKANNEIVTKATDPKTSISLCQKFETLNNEIRDNKIGLSSALKEIQNQIPEIKSDYYKQGGKDWKEDTWIFPLQDYSSSAIGGSNGNGYIASGYNYFDGNKHGGHPAHDIFIQDNNQDCKDDRTNNYVSVLSFSGGIVLATENNWVTSSQLRGGKYIWIFDPYSNSLFYYAHNNKILVASGQIITPGQTIATVGRTGLNAFKKRSPTHLHFTQLRFNNNFYPKPIDTYKELLEAKRQ